MAEQLKLRKRVLERPQSHWQSIAVETLGCQTRIVQGERWHHRILEKGDGPPLFLYHGVGGHVDTYARTLPQLAEHFHVYAVDALYHGFSSKEPWDADNRTHLQAEAYVDLLHALGYERAHYEGESMGAGIGFEIGMSFPETVDKMILNGFGAVQTKRTEFKEQPWKGDLFDLSRKAVANPTYENIHKRLLWLVHDDSTINNEMIMIRKRLYETPEVNASMRRVFGLEGPPNPWTQYTEEETKARWKTDTLVMYGTYNPGRGPDYGNYCADLIGAKFYEVKDTGHWPQWEKPDEYVEALLSFLLDGKDSVEESKLAAMGASE
jgi:pimeloyl-ACP methyl ester carboxylesterase